MANLCTHGSWGQKHHVGHEPGHLYGRNCQPCTSAFTRQHTFAFLLYVHIHALTCAICMSLCKRVEFSFYLCILLNRMMCCHMHYSLVFKIRHLPYGPSIEYPFTGARAKFILYDQQILLTRGKERGWEREREREREPESGSWEGCLLMVHRDLTIEQATDI